MVALELDHLGLKKKNSHPPVENDHISGLYPSRATDLYIKDWGHSKGKP